MNNTTSARLMVALLFAIAFAIIGSTAPVIYAAHAPSDQFLTVDEFTAQNASTDAEKHYICLDRNVKQGTSGTTFTELYLINDRGDRIEVGGRTDTRYFQEGSHEVITRTTLPNGLEPGTYRYLLVVEMSLADGRVERPFVFNSEEFYIGPAYSDSPDRDSFDC